MDGVGREAKTADTDDRKFKVLDFQLLEGGNRALAWMLYLIQKEVILLASESPIVMCAQMCAQTGAWTTVFCAQGYD